ncbi:MAG TPA: S8 family peptidase [Steroidobacteraceae bacterium]|nr:S8 family peptidase [Steroidobacteraceae bacterium]
MPRTVFHAVLSTASLLVLCACGGGGGSGGADTGGGGEPPPPPPPPPPPATTGAIEGRLLVASISQSDADVNDPSAPYAPNDTREQAQALPVPVALGGYVNEPGRGPAGRSFEAGDVHDVFVADLATGQVIELVLPTADPTQPDARRDDADLELYDAAGTLVDESIGLGQLERLRVTRTGRYYVRVSAFSGAPLYRLSIGEAASTAAAADDLTLGAEFVPGELIVTYARPTGTSSSKPAHDDPTSGLAARHGVARKAGAPDREMLLALDASGDAKRRDAAASATAGPRRDAGGFVVPQSLRAKHATLLAAKRLRADADVRTADLNLRLRTAAVPDDPSYRLQRWHYEMIRLPAAWDVTQGRTDVIVAVVDTGVVRAHPDLAGKLVDGFDFIRDTANEDGDGVDADADDPGCVVGGGSVFHGTHVAGTVAAATNNARGVAGVGWNVRVMPVRALDGCAGSGNSYDIAQAVRFAAGLDNDSGQVPARPADVINLSLGALAPCDATSQSLFAEVHARGTVVVAAAGNETTSTESSPAACPNVLAVAAVDSRAQLAVYSNFGSWVDLAAPGGDMRFDENGDGQVDGVYSTHATGGGTSRQPTYRLLQGTSMAAPHVAGVIALMKSVAPDLTATQVDLLLQQGRLTQDIGAAGRDELGMGLVDAAAAMQAALGAATPLPPEVALLPAAVNLGDVSSHADVTVVNGGSGALTITAVRTSASWLRATPTAVDANGLGRYSVTVERSGLATGTQEGWVEFVSDAGTKRLAVVLLVASSTFAPDAGLQYVLLQRPQTRDAAGPQATLRVAGAAVPYRLDDVPAGQYLVVAGTDMDNDGVICDDGEACGAYPVEPEPIAVEIAGATVSGVDFTTAFRTNVEADR